MTVAGHTKFEQDCHFGVWKWRNTNAETIYVVVQSVLSSSKSGHNTCIPHLTNDSENPVIFYVWKKYLIHHFRIRNSGIKGKQQQ